MIAPDMDHRVVTARGAGHEPEIFRSIKLKIKPHHRVLEIRVLIEDPFVIASDLVASQHALLHLPFLVEEPATTHLPFGKVIAEFQISRGRQQRPRRNARTHLRPPFRQPALQSAHALRLLNRQIRFLRGILREIEERVFFLFCRIKKLD